MAYIFHPDEITSEERETIADVERVVSAVRELGPNAKISDIKKLYEMLKPGRPDELEYVTIEEADTI